MLRFDASRFIEFAHPVEYALFLRPSPFARQSVSYSLEVIN